MLADDYQQLALRTAKSDHSQSERLANWALGLAGEAGETADYLKKVLFHGHALDTRVAAREASDALWYIAVLADDLGFKLSELMQMNIDKLKARYPDGFGSQASIDRADAR